MGRHDDTDEGRADDVHDASIDRDDFSGIPDAEPTNEHHEEAARLLAEHDPAEWDMRGDD